MRDNFGDRKRIELTDGELALGSWLYITYKIIIDKDWDDIYVGKDEYLSAHHFSTHWWSNGCILCEKHIRQVSRSCGRCPLKRIQKKKGVNSKDWCGCGANSWYENVCYKSKATHSKRISSAINICNVLAKELRKERKGKEIKWKTIRRKSNEVENDD